MTLATILEASCQQTESSDLLKETLAAIGMLAVVPEHRDALITLQVITHVLTAARENLKISQVVKTALGSLINLTSGKESDMLAKDPSYYQVLYSVIEEIQDKGTSDYVLKLVSNTLHIPVAMDNYQSGALIPWLWKLLQSAQDPRRVLLGVRVLRQLFNGGAKGRLKLTQADLNMPHALTSLVLRIWEEALMMEEIEVFNEAMLFLADVID